MLDARTYHENFDSITDAADRVVEVRDWRLKLLENEVKDLLQPLQQSNLYFTSGVTDLYFGGRNETN